MNDDDLDQPTLTPPPTTSPVIRGAAIAVVGVALVVTGCGSPGAPLANDAGLDTNVDSDRP